MTKFNLKRIGMSLRRMRPTLISMALLLSTAPVWQAHAATQEKKVSISLRNVGYDKVFDEITRQTGYTFLYNNAQVDRNAQVTVDEKDVSVARVLDKLFTGKGLSYSMVGNQIVVTPRQAPQKNRNGRYDVRVHVADEATGIPLVGTTCNLPNLGIYGIADADGSALLRDVPAGETAIEIRMLGYKPINTTIDPSKDGSYSFRMEQLSLSMEEVMVVGTRTANSLSTSTTIERQAIDHIQATSLGDLLELMPGQALRGARTLSSVEQLRFRTLHSDANNSFGAAVFIDGMQLSNNANLESQITGGYNTTGGGIDLRAISTDDIDYVEVIQGIPSVEYGDLTSGAMIVKTNVGESPLRLRVKFTPGLWQTSANQGWHMDGSNSTLNASLDYALSSGDPRNKASSADRINGSIGYGAYINNDWRTNTRFRVSSLIDWRGTDPDVKASGSDIKSKNYNFNLSHDGTISVNRNFSRTITYNLGVQYSHVDMYETRYQVTGQSIYPLFNATETGLHEATVLLPNSYHTGGGTKSRPLSFSAKVTNNFYVNTAAVNQRFNMGIEYRFEKNYGAGNYNDDENYPYHREFTRERSYKDIPGINNISAYFEDNITAKLFGRQLQIQAGVRFTGIQPFKDEFVYGISPRVNMRYDVADRLTLRGSFGKTAKTPGLTHLYPENLYRDHRIVSYLPNDPAEQLVMYYTNVTRLDYSKGLKNSTATRWGAGFDIKLPGNIIMSVDAYRDYNPNGFSGIAAYSAYYLRTYDVGRGITPVPGQKPTLDFLTPGYDGLYDKEAVVWNSLGLVGNESRTLDQGIEFSFDLGRISAINTSIYLSGAYMESKGWTTGRYFSNPTGGKLALGTTDTPQFKLEYPTGNIKDLDQRMLTTLRLVYNIPQLRMVASGAFQVTWMTRAKTLYDKEVLNPIGYMKFDYVDGRIVESYTPITAAMLADEEYRIDGVLLRDQIRDYTRDRATITPPLFVFNVRLTKNFAEAAAFSFYANNASYYQPWQKYSSINSTMTERNTDISFGFELSFTF